VKKEYLISGLVGAGVGALGYHLAAKRAPAWVNQVLRDMEVTVTTPETQFTYVPTLDKPNVTLLKVTKAKPESPVLQTAYVGCEDLVDPETLKPLPRADMDFNEPLLILYRYKNGNLGIDVCAGGRYGCRVAFRGDVIIDKPIGPPARASKTYRNVFPPVK